MECCSSSMGFFSPLQKPPPLLFSSLYDSTLNSTRNNNRSVSCSVASAHSYRKFLHFVVDETKRHTHLLPSPLQLVLFGPSDPFSWPPFLVDVQTWYHTLEKCEEKFSSMISTDGKTELQMLSFTASQIRLLRSLSIENETMQVLDFTVFPEPEFDMPIFCANFFTAASTNIVVLDLNPLHDVINHEGYKEKYFRSLMPLGRKYAELLPWGGKLTSESLNFFSPIVLWTKFTSTQENHDILYSAFMDYYKAWLKVMDEATKETDVSQILLNREAQHRYLTWRAEKDPGHQVLKRLIGEAPAKELLRNFLFEGIDKLGSKTFLDYFPEYRCEDGSVNEKRSMTGKSFDNRPWDSRGQFIGNS